MKRKISKKKSSENLELPKKVGIIYSDVKREYFASDQAYITEKDSKKHAEVIADYLTKLEVSSILFPGNSQIFETIKKAKPEMVINLVDSVKGSEYLAATIPAILEILEIPYTGAGILGQSLSNNKYLVQKLLQQSGIPSPLMQLINSPNDYLDPTLRYPLISKLNETHGSVEIDENAVSENEKHLRERLKNLINTYYQPVLVEEFVVGREVSALLLEGFNKKVYIGERTFSNLQQKQKYNIVSFDMKWVDEESFESHYQKYDDPILKEYIRKAFEICRMADYGRFDIKIDNSGRYYFIDSNCNPFLGPSEVGSSVGQILDVYGVDFDDGLKRILINTMYVPDEESLITTASEQNIV